MSETKPIDRLPPRKTHMKISLAVQGVFAFPDEWRQTDEANQGVFQYSVAFLDTRIANGKVIPRELTEKEKKEIEEAEAAKKAKKGGKKETKIEPPKLTPEEEKAKQLQEQQELEEQQRLQEEWDALTEEEKFFKTSEDPFKSASIKFEQTILQQELNGQNFVIQQERFRVDKGEYLMFYKSPTLGEEEVAKLRKSKPKTLNINDLNIVVFKGWIDYGVFEEQGKAESIQRIKFTQYLDETAPPETPQPNVENMYMLIKINLSTPFSPVLIQPQPKFQDIIPLAPPPIPMALSQQCIEELRNDLQIIIESLAMEYSNMFSKELNKYQEDKQTNILMTHKKGQLQTRKEHYLYDFNISGKYKILKERIKRSIVRLCRDKFQKFGSVTGISTTQTDQFYSELYVFLMEEMRNVLANLVRENKEALQEDFAQLLGKQNNADVGNQELIERATAETKKEQIERLCCEYEILFKNYEVEKNYSALLTLNPKDIEVLMKFAYFYLRSDKLNQAESLVEQALSFDGNNLSNQLLLSALYYKKDKFKEAKFILELLLDRDPNNLGYHLFYYLIMQSTDQDLAEFMMKKAERIWLRQLKMIPAEGSHFNEPQLYDIPWIKIPIPPPDKPEKDKAILEQKEQQRIAFENAHKQPELNQEQHDQMILQLVEFFEQACLFEMAEKAINLLNDKNNPKIEKLQAKIYEFKLEFNFATSIYEKLLERDPKDISSRLDYIKLLYKGSMFEECEKQIRFVLPNPELKEDFMNYYSMYLLLGNIYLQNKQFQNARAVLSKLVIIKQNSSLAWLGLGIASHECEQYNESENALKMANLYEPKNDQVWGYLALNCLKHGSRFREANSALREMKKTEISQVQLLARLSKEFYKISQFQTAKELLQSALHLAEQQDVLSNEIIEYQIQLAETNEKLGQIDQAIELYQEALLRIEDFALEKDVKDQIERLNFQQLIKY